MKSPKMSPCFSVLSALLVSLFFCLPAETYAHCDTLDGPVVQTARMALEKGDVTPLLITPAIEHVNFVLCSISNLGMFEIALYMSRSLQKSSHERAGFLLQIFSVADRFPRVDLVLEISV